MNVHRNDIDLLKGLAILAVVAYHLGLGVIMVIWSWMLFCN